MSENFQMFLAVAVLLGSLMLAVMALSWLAFEFFFWLALPEWANVSIFIVCLSLVLSAALVWGGNK